MYDVAINPVPTDTDVSLTVKQSYPEFTARSARTMPRHAGSIEHSRPHMVTASMYVCTLPIETFAMVLPPESYANRLVLCSWVLLNVTFKVPQSGAPVQPECCRAYVVHCDCPVLGNTDGGGGGGGGGARTFAGACECADDVGAPFVAR